MRPLFSGNVDLTVDTRLLTEDGRAQIKNDFVDTYELGEDIYRASEQLNQSDQLGLLNFWTALNNNTKATNLKNDLLRNPDNAHIVAGLTSGDGQQYAEAMSALGQLAQDKFGLELTQVYFYDGAATTSASLADNVLTDVKGATVIDENNSQYGNIFIDAEGTKNDQVNTLGHEILETQTLQNGDENSATQEALANAFGGQFEDRIDQATGSQLSSTSTSSWSQSLNNSQSVRTGTQAANQVGNAAVDHRQLDRVEIDWIKTNASKFAQELSQKEGRPVSEVEAKQRLTRELLRRVDSDWANYFADEGVQEDHSALTFLATGLSDDGGLYVPSIESDVPQLNTVSQSYNANEIQAALINYDQNNPDSYNNPNQNGEYLALEMSSESQFYKDTLQVDASVLTTLYGDAGSVAGSVDELVQLTTDALNTFDAFADDPIGTLKNMASGAVGLVMAPDQVLEQANDLLEQRKIEASLARLRGDEYTAAKIEAETNMEVLAMVVPATRVVRVTKASSPTVVAGSLEGPEGSAPKNSDLNIGQNNPNYNAAAQQQISNNRGSFDKQFEGKFTSEKEANAAFQVYQETNKSGKELVIGRLDDTAAGSQIGLQRLNNPDWSINVNDAWVQGGIDAKRKFYLGSPETPKNLWDAKNNRPTVLAREIQQLKQAGYIKQGDYYVHPSTIGGN